MLISVVIPVLNEEPVIASAVAGARAAGFNEVIIADGGSTDATRSLAGNAGAVVLDASRGRAAQMNAGARRATGEVLLFLHADTILPTTARTELEHALSDSSTVAGCFRVSFDRRHPILDVSAWASRFDTAFTTFGDQAYFVRRAAFEAVGGFPDQPLMEDVEMRRRLRRIGRFRKAPVAVTTSARRFEKTGVARQQALNGLLLISYLLGASPERLKRFYA